MRTLSAKQVELLTKLADGAGMAYVRETKHTMRTLRSLEGRGLVRVSGRYYAEQKVGKRDVSITITAAGQEALRAARGEATPAPARAGKRRRRTA